MLVDKDFKTTLLTHHRKIGKWFQLGGHCDGDPNPFNVAMKEAVEEGGIQDFHFLYSFPGVFDLDVQI